MNIKYYYYISRNKVNLLKGQLIPKAKLSKLGAKAEIPGISIELGLEKDSAPNDETRLIEDVSTVIQALQKQNEILPLVEEGKLDSSALYSDSSNWHHGLYSLKMTETDEQLISYIAWKASRNRIFLLLGSPSNILGEAVVSEGSEYTLPSSRTVNKIVESSLQWEFVKTIDDCETLEPGEFSLKIDAEQPPSLKVDIHRAASPRLIKAQNDVLRGNALAIFCTSALERLPSSQLETVFKIYHVLPVSRAAAPYDAVYVGSPIYTALL
jgi:hypothetical protein